MTPPATAAAPGPPCWASASSPPERSSPVSVSRGQCLQRLRRRTPTTTYPPTSPRSTCRVPSSRIPRSCARIATTIPASSEPTSSRRPSRLATRSTVGPRSGPGSSSSTKRGSTCNRRPRAARDASPPARSSSSAPGRNRDHRCGCAPEAYVPLDVPSSSVDLELNRRRFGTYLPARRPTIGVEAAHQRIHPGTCPRHRGRGRRSHGSPSTGSSPRRTSVGILPPHRTCTPARPPRWPSPGWSSG